MMVRLHRITKEGCSCHVRDFCRIVCRSSETDILTPVTDNWQPEIYDQPTISILNILVYNRLPSALFDIRCPVRDVRKWFCFYTVNCGEIVSILDTIDDFNITHQTWEHGANGVMCLGCHWHSVCTFLIIWMTQHHHHSWQDSCPSFSVYSQHVLWSHQTSFLQVHGDDDNDDEQNHDDDMMMTLFISESEISSASEQFRWRTCADTINNRCFWHLFKFSLQPLVQRDEQWFYEENRRLEKVGYHKTNGVRIVRRDQMVLATDLTIPFPPGQDSFVTRIRNSSAECNNLYPVTNQSTACPFTHVSCPWDNILVALSVNKLF